MQLPVIRFWRTSLFAASMAIASLAESQASFAAVDGPTAIRHVMDASVVAWARGDLAGFMETYEDSPNTLFVGEQGVVRGKTAIAARYAATFGNAGPGSLGKLSFDTLEIRPLGPHYALMLGRYHLQPADAAKPEASGLFSLVFHEKGGRWRIVCDHTS